MSYFYIIATLFFTVYGQLIIKWRLDKLGFSIPDNCIGNKFFSLVVLIFDPYILSGFVSAFIASLFWMATLTKFELTRAYPMMSLAPSIVFILGVWVFHESFSWGKVIGLLLILTGSIISTRF